MLIPFMMTFNWLLAYFSGDSSSSLHHELRLAKDASGKGSPKFAQNCHKAVKKDGWGVGLSSRVDPL